MKKILAVIVMVMSVLVVPNVALAECSVEHPEECSSLCNDMTPEELAEYGLLAGCTETKTAGSVIDGILTVVLSAVGIIAVGVMIYGGVQYMLSSGDPTKAKRARDILIYGAVGLIVCLLAYAIVRFVLASIG